ncbi:MAG: LysR family transcriptional regulator [Lachnospiraceae bacterium]
MDERKLKTFLAAVETGSFNKAADQMNFSQSAVSQMMNSLESELGCRLLVRGNAGIELTAAGRELLPLIE